jgi:cobalt-zinc-cadmium efflux system protein
MAHDHHHDHDHEHGQDAHHGHHHGHGHSHAHDLGSYGRAFVIAIVLNSLFIAAEFIYGVIANSTALIADAGHNLSDVLGLALSLAALLLAKRPPSSRYTYGLGSSSILAALANAIFLLVACGAIAWEAIGRFAAPPQVSSLTVTVVAGIGILVNGISAWLFVRGKSELNMRSAYLHMAADAVISLGVVVAGLIMMGTGWYWLDPLVSVVIVAVIVYGTWDLLRESTQLALSAVPEHIDLDAVAKYLEQQPGVDCIHDLHIWGMSTTEAALTVHLVMPEGYPGDAYVDALTRSLQERFGIVHSTLQVEQGTTEHACCLQQAT